MKRKSKGRDGKSSVDILEEAFHLLRANTFLLLPYYFGSLPFILGVLYFWTDMSTGADAWNHCSEAAWGLTLLFIWMKTWQSLYARRLLGRIRGDTPSAWGLRRMLRMAAIQTAIQPWGIFILPIALIIMLPFPQAFAFFQNASLIGSGDGDDLRSVVQKSWRQALLWPMQNTLLIWLTSPFLLGLAAFFVFVLIPVSSSFNPEVPIFFLFMIATLVAIPLCPLGVVTALNIIMALLLLPWLLKILFGIETIFSISGTHVMNNTFFAVVCSLSYLCLDPLMKACYCLRCFYGESLQTGEDLKVELRSCASPGSVTALLIAVFLIFAPFNKSLAQSSPIAGSVQGNPVSAQQLNAAIESIIHYPEYSWRLPREKPPDAAVSHSAFYVFFDSIINTLKTGWNYVKKGLAKAWNFIKKILSRILPPLPKLEKPDLHWTAFSRVWIIIPLACIVIVLAFLAWRAWRNRRPRTIEADVITQPPLDITREDLDATALPEEGWLNLAGELMEKGELRLALRALYLATLAYLARQEFITLAKYKSDREYELELRRRSHSQPLLAGVFAENKALFERGWYGLHEVTSGIMERFSQNQEKIRIHAQR
jgi:hypothetical protein